METDVAEISKELDPTTSLYCGVYPARRVRQTRRSLATEGRSARYYPDGTLFGRDPSDSAWSVEDPALRGRRWMSVDPLAKKYPGWSPYNYVRDNPAGLTDPDGKGWYETNTSNVPHYDPNINSQAELNKSAIGYTYLGQTTFTVDKQGNPTFYNANGSSGAGVFMAPTQTVTAMGKPTTTLEKLSLITTSADFSVEAGKSVLRDLATAQDFLYQSDAIRGIVGSAEHFTTFAGALNAGLAFGKFVQNPTTRNLVNLGVESIGAVPSLSLGVTLLDVSGLKHDLLQRIPNEKLF